MAKKKRGKRKWALGDSENVPTQELVEVHRELAALRVDGFIHDHRRRARGTRRIKPASDESGLVRWSEDRHAKLDIIRKKAS